MKDSKERCQSRASRIPGNPRKANSAGWKPRTLYRADSTGLCVPPVTEDCGNSTAESARKFRAATATGGAPVPPAAMAQAMTWSSSGSRATRRGVGTAATRSARAA